jgi:XRE family aerobic/anaerobic benzoate catabolism transcriptional regulator
MTRKILARDSGVSERYLAQLEAGRGNVSVLVLLSIADAMAMPIDLLLRDGEVDMPLKRKAMELIARMGETDLRGTIDWLREKAPVGKVAGRAKRIALIGLRGAGKSTLGRFVAERLGFPFIELNRMIEADYGGSLDDLFSLAGQPAYRRYESRCLARVLDEHESVVIATGGGIVTNDAAFEALLALTHTMWIQATPQEHMSRVVEQGDLRPMADNREAMRDLRQILSARESAYSRALVAVDTSGQTIAESSDQVLSLARNVMKDVVAGH